MTVFIYFVGLITLVTSPSEPTQKHILIPNFPRLVTAENNVIAIPEDLVLTGPGQTDWPFTNEGGTDFFYIGTQNIHVSGDKTFSMGKPFDLPALTCCCSNMKKGLKADYNDSNEPPGSKKAG